MRSMYNSCTTCPVPDDHSDMLESYIVIYNIMVVNIYVSNIYDMNKTRPSTIRIRKDCTRTQSHAQ